MQIKEFTSLLKRQGFRDGAGVPCSYFKPLVNEMEVDPELSYLSAASEGEAVAIAAGLITAGRPAYALMQNSGLGNAVNPVTSMVAIYGMPVVLLVSHRGQPGGKPDEPQHRLMGEITEDLARLCELETFVLDEASFAEQLRETQQRGVAAAWICRKGTLEGGAKLPARELVLRVGELAVPASGRFAPQMGREEALRQLLPLINGEAPPAVVSTTGKLSRELYELDDRDHSRRNRFYMVGSLGCAAGFGLGIAKAQPQRKVMVLDGDGAVLMKMGTLATIGAVGPENLHHVVFDNGAHESTGGQPTSSPGVDFAAIALACGYRLAETVASEADFRGALDRHLSSPGPTFLRLAVRQGSRADLGRPKLSPRDGWLRFSDFLADGSAAR
jgi:phosphonopyruvate decarboxylase